MPVIYGGQAIVPAPQVSLSKSYATSGDGHVVGTTITARLTGTLVAQMNGYTFTPVATNSRLSVLLEKADALRAIFSQNGQMFEAQGFDGSPPTKFNAIVDSIDFSEGPWVDKTDYTIVLHGDVIAGEDATTYHCDNASESWTFEEGDLPRTWKATHTISAKGKLIYDAAGTIPKPSWQYAKDFVTATLALGWTGVTADPYWQDKAGQTLAGLSAVQPPTSAWDRHITETVDELDGTYSVSETWTLNPNSYVEAYTISARRVDEPGTTTTVSVSGSVTGLRTSMGINDDKYNAALAQWPTIRDQIVARCQQAATSVSGGTLSAHPLTYEVDHDRYNGVINYQIEFSDRVYTNDTFEVYTIAKSVSDEDYRTTVRIDGTITGVIYLDEGASTTIKFTRAQLQWEIVRPLLFARVVAETGINTLNAFPVQAQSTDDPYTGTIQYSYEFDDRTPSDVRNEFTAERRYSRDDGYNRVTVQGTITGLRSAHADNPFGTGDAAERFNNAKAYYAGISGNLLGMAAQYVSLSCINPTAVNTSVSYNPLAGTVGYSAEFTSQLAPVTAGALSEVVSQTDDAGVEQIAILPVFGRGAAGPIIQDMGSVKESRRTISVEIVMTPPQYGCTTFVGQPSFDITPYVPTGARVFKEQDNTLWAERQGRYNRTVSWVYTL